MANQVRILQVMSGSNVVHQLLDSGEVEFNRASNAGAFSVSGSVSLGPEDNHISSGSFMAGLFRVPHYTSADDSSLLTTLAGSGLAAGDYNGRMFYMSGSGITSGDATAVSYFSRGDCLYFCRNGIWFADLHNDHAEVSNVTDFWVTRFSSTLSFEHGQGWPGTVSSPDVSSRTFSASTTNTETFEASTGFNKIFSDVDLSSFSNNWTVSTESLSFTSAEGFIGEPVDISSFTFSAEATNQLTYEASTGFNKIFSDIDLSTFSNDWTVSTELLSFTAAEGFPDEPVDISSFSFSAETTGQLTYEASTGFNKIFSDIDLSTFSNDWTVSTHTEDPYDWA